ncbi:MAG: 4-hydroxy-tetrahydrodipicolinate synthase [Candidatus Obscuribacterales bacterium]|nr:4-hydroxy-tetrahydrodipicolinate synthase [Candidatus Obscuribacterales bacterium]
MARERAVGLFGRVVTAMVTPFDSNNQIDYEAVVAITNHLIDTGSTAIVVAGTTGESPTLEDGEKSELLKVTIKAASGRAKIIMGAGSNDTAKSIKAAKEAESLGADGLLIVAPYYNKPSQDGLKAHFSAIAKATKLPIMLYNIPGRTGITIGVDTVLDLADKHPNIVALKDSTGTVELAQDIGRLVKKGFYIYSGDDNLTLPFLAIGACGVVSVASHIIGNEIKQMLDAYFSGNVEEALRLHYRNLPLFKGLFIAPNPTCVKYALSKIGLCHARLRLPLIELNDSQQKAMNDLLKDIPETKQKTLV